LSNICVIRLVPFTLDKNPHFRIWCCFVPEPGVEKSLFYRPTFFLLHPKLAQTAGAANGCAGRGGD